MVATATSAGVGLLVLAMLLTSYGASAAAGEPDASAAASASTGAERNDARPLTLSLPNGSTARVDRATGVATITSKAGTVTYKLLPQAAVRLADGSRAVPDVDRAALVDELMKRPVQHYAPDHIVVVFDAGSAPLVDTFAVPGRGAAGAPRGAAVPSYTRDQALNATLARIGVTAESRLFATMSRSRLDSLVGAARTADNPSLVDLANAYVLALNGADPVAAVQTLTGRPGVQVATLDWYVQAPGTQTTPLTAEAKAAAEAQAAAMQHSPTTGRVTAGGQDSATSRAATDLPSNWGLQSSAQSFWNNPGLDAAAGYGEIVDRFGELPGTGQRITDVSIGDLTDDNPESRCFEAGFGPTTIVRNGQRYIDLPSMPLVPTFTASQAGRLNPLGEVCGPDPLLRAIGHELSVMAPLPHDRQRPGHEGSGLTDLIGLAPGAKYRVVVPSSAAPTVSDVASALLASAEQTPRPTVITTGLVAGGDSAGFPQRYLEQDAVAASVVSVIVDGLGIPVVAGAGDGIRRNSSIAAIGPTGGAAATDVVSRRAGQTVLDDIAWSTAPSKLHRSGAIVVGASTTDDIFARPPHYPATMPSREQQPFAATRWTGATDYATGYGTRVDVSAPGDSILSMSHAAGGSAEDPQPNLAEGTGLAAAEVAAVVADLSQVAVQTGRPFEGAREARSLLSATATPLAEMPQADPRLRLGGQVNLRRAVERLLEQSGDPVAPGAGRMAVAQRRAVANLDAVFETGTDPGHIDLLGPRSPYDGTLTGANLRAWITIAPDWRGVPADATFTLSNADTGEQLARGRSARLLPEEILASAGAGALARARADDRTTVPLVYRAEFAGQQVEVDGSITFGRAPKTSTAALAPKVSATVKRNWLFVSYDLRRTRGLQAPVHLVVSYPGRVNPATGAMYEPLVTRELPFSPGDPSTRLGRLRIPLTDLHGAGIFGVGLHLADQDVDGMLVPVYSDFAYVRVPDEHAEGAPAAPLVGVPGRPLGHSVTVPMDSKIRLHWDVSSVPTAIGAMIEISSPGPASALGVNMFNNPEGNWPDDNGVDSSSVRAITVYGQHGFVTRTADRLRLVPTMTHSVRVIAFNSSEMLIGVASPVSSVTRQGVELSGSGAVNETGFGIGPSSGDGYAATRGFGPALGVHATVQGFQLSPPSTGRVLEQSHDGSTTYDMVGNGLYGPGGTGLVRTYDFGSGETYGYSSVTDGDFANWTPPQPARLVVQAGGADPAGKDGAFVAYDSQTGSPTSYDVFTSDVSANTFGTPLDLSDALSAANVARARQVVYDAQGGRGMAAFVSNDFCAAPTLVQFDTADRTTHAVTGQGFGDPFSMAVSPSSGLVAVANTCSSDMGLYDMDSGQSSLVSLDQNGYYVAVDDQNGLILVGKAVPPDFLNNHSAQSSIAVYRLDGSYVRDITGVYYWDIALVPGVDELQLDTATRTLWTFGPFGTALEPLPY